VVGFADGRIPQFPVNLALVKNFSIVGLYWGAYALRNPKIMADSLTTLADWYTQGKIKPHISHILPLAEAATALNLLINRQSTGKIVLTVP
jgi:NADPH2:quinone reductase